MTDEQKTPQETPTAGSACSAGLSALGWPVGVPFTFYDSPGEHDPCFVVMPGGCSLPLNHCATAEMDIARAKFIIDACNAALAKLQPKPKHPAGFVRNPNPSAPPWEREKLPR